MFDKNEVKFQFALLTVGYIADYDLNGTKEQSERLC